MDSKRVFIVSDKQFPHGDAGGNRIEYMAKSFAYEGMQPIVISLGLNTTNEYDSQHNFYRYEDIIYKNAKVSKTLLSWYILSGYKAKNILKKFVPKEGEPIVIYSTNPIFVSFIKYSYEKRCRLFYDVVEWDDKNSFMWKKCNPHYWLFNWCFKSLFPSGKGIIAISRNIQKYFIGRGCKTTLYPICLDPSKFIRDYNERNYNKLRLIYPGNPENKDDIKTVLEAISSLSKQQQQQLELHFTSVSKMRIERQLGGHTQLLEDLDSIIVFHPWMEYEDLVKLYYSVDALIMLRYNNQVCQSNFPSKVPELLSCGVFIIANDCGDFFCYLEDGTNAIKIKSNIVSDCASAILDTLSLNIEERKKMSQNAVRCANEKFSYTMFSKKLSDFIIAEK